MNVDDGNIQVMRVFSLCTNLLYEFAKQKSIFPEHHHKGYWDSDSDSETEFSSVKIHTLYTWSRKLTESTLRFDELYTAFCKSDIPPHQNGWGNITDPSDRSASAYIENLNEMRKSYDTLRCETLAECYETLIEIRQLVNGFVLNCTKKRYDSEDIYNYTLRELERVCALNWNLKDLPVHIPGGSRRIQCRAQAVFMPNVQVKLQASKFVWQKQENSNFQPIDFSGKKMKFRIGLENSLIINFVGKDDSGVYQLKIITQEKEIFLSNRVILRVSPLIKDSLEIEPKKGMMESEDQTGRLTMPLKGLPTHKEYVFRECIERDKDFLQNMLPLNFVKTQAWLAARKFIKMHQCTIITGRRGDGKTTLGYQCLQDLVEEGMEPLILRRPGELYDIPPNGNLAIFVDDVIETNYLIPNFIQELVLGIESIISRKQSKSVGENKYIFVIQKDCLCYIRHFLKENWQIDSTIDISSFQDHNDRTDLLEMYAPGEPDIERIANAKEYIYEFPECCKIFGKEQDDNRSFLNTTCEVLGKHIKKMTCSYFIALATLSVRGGEIPRKDIIDQTAQRLLCNDIAVSCNIQYDESFLCSLLSFSDEFFSVCVSFDTERNVFHFKNDIVKKSVTRRIFDINPVYLIKSCDINCVLLACCGAILPKNKLNEYIDVFIERLEKEFNRVHVMKLLKSFLK